MTSHIGPLLAATAVFAMLVDVAFSADIQRGERLYQSCAPCHVVDDNRNSFGPYLKGIIGRRAGSVAGYSYSPAIRMAGSNGLVWSKEDLAEFLSSPKRKVPGTTMRFWGMWSSEIGDLIAYLKAHP